jgi:hypothetical protein
MAATSGAPFPALEDGAPRAAGGGGPGPFSIDENRRTI